ncbi:MAG: hypothetical protein HY762_09300, partial [Planctomycetes bacterium]|nr:hypothetical protein [Planctomycetota bacterium]
MSTCPEGRRKGLALVLTILVLSLLVLLATPFVVSMTYKEKTSKNFFNTTQSRFVAEGSFNYAASQLARTCFNTELQPGARAPFNTPDYDTENEFLVNFPTVTNPPGQIGRAGFNDPKGAIWSANVHDEQSKIALLTAPARLVNNIKSLLKPVDDPREFLTEYSWRATGWVEPQNLVGYQHYEDRTGLARTILYLDHQTFYFAESQRSPALSGGDEGGVRVRLTNRNKEFLAIVNFQPCGPPCQNIRPVPLSYNPHPHPNFIARNLKREMFRTTGTPVPIFLDRIVPEEFISPETIIEVEQPHAVNINTASREVLIGLLRGVGIRYRLPDGRIVDERITPDQAAELTGEIKRRVFKNPTDYLSFLGDAVGEKVIEGRQAGYLWTSARYPRSATLTDFIGQEFTGTLPFCYRSEDVYKITSSGIVNYPSGTQAVRTTFNDIADLGPADGKLTWSIQSQYDFDTFLNMPMGNLRRVITYPKLTNPSSKLHSFADVPRPAEPDYSRDDQAGELKLRAAEDKRGNYVVKRDSFPDYHEGAFLGGSALTYNTGEIFAFESDLTVKPDVKPGGIECWVKFNGAPGGTIFDIKQKDYENRFTLYYQNNELILSVCDATVERKAAQVRAQIALSERTWYHFGAYWKGTKCSQLALFVDGKPVGEFGHYNDTDQKITTELTADLSTTATNIAVKATTGFPDRGVLEIGREAIEYDGITGSGFQVRVIWDNTQTPPVQIDTGRGKRGT